MSTDHRHRLGSLPLAAAILVPALLAACHKDEPPPPGDTTPTDVSAVVADAIPTVITVTWHTASPSSGHVSFGVDGALDRATPDDAPTTDHRAVLVGLPADREVSWQIVSEGEAGDVSTSTTGSLPADLEQPTVTGEGNGSWLLTTLVGDPNVIVLLDPDGQITWWYTDRRGLSVFRGLVARDGQGVIYSSAIVAGGPAPDSAIVRVSWDGSQVDEIAVPNLAHDFVERPDGAIVSVVYETRDDILGSGIAEIGADGAATPIWSAWDCLDPVANPGDDPEHGWTHANAMDWLEDEGRYLVGLRNLGTIVQVDPADASCDWALGGSGGDMDVDGSRFIHEHQFQKVDGRLLVFDNDGAPGNESRAIEYSLDEAGGAAAEEAIWTADPVLYSFIMGDVHRFDDGDTLLVYSVPGTILRLRPDGSEAWRLVVGGDHLLGFAQVLASPYEVP